MAIGDRWLFLHTNYVGAEQGTVSGMVTIKGDGWMKRYRVANLMQVAVRLPAATTETPKCTES